jgi:hypothetical protein
MPDTVCLIATVRSPVNELLEFTGHHLAAGIDAIILFFDDPNDPAIGSLAAHSNVISIVCDAGYWDQRRSARPGNIETRQIANVNFGLQLARARSYDWIIHLDGDELLSAQNAIGTVLSRYSADVVRFAMKEAVAEHDHYTSRFQATLFREPLTTEGRRRLASLSPADLDGVLLEGEYFRAHSGSKVAVRLNSRLLRMGIHGPERPTMPEVQTSQIVLLHYDCVGIEDWQRKWLRRMDSSGTAIGMRPARAKQLDLFQKVYGDESRERALYGRLHRVSPRQRELLLEIGLLTVISPRLDTTDTISSPGCQP